MLQEVRDLRAEGDELEAFLQTLEAEVWQRATPFKRWTVWDVLAHLHFTDREALLALRSPEAFRESAQRMVAAMRAGTELIAYTREQLGPLDPKVLRQRWCETLRTLCDELGTRDAKARLPWYGPDMGVRMFTTARQMEVWAHGQDIYDLLGHERTDTDRIRNIAVIGVKTFGWTFANRGLEVPREVPYVRLTAPSGALWEWGDAGTQQRVEGSAVDFCHVVTQGRNVAETGLRVVGETAKRWMAIAQCFAGAAADPPQPGERTGGVTP